MSYVFNMVGGGSGGGSGPTAADAILTVTVPSGSTVTATKGNTILTPTMWTAAGDATNDCALFVIRAALFDSVTPWMVRITNGTNTASDTILIDSNKQYNMVLDFNYWIVKHGALVKPFTIATYANLEQTDDFVLMSITGANYGRITTQSALDFSSFSTLKIVLMRNDDGRYGASWNGTTYYPSIGYGANAPTSTSTPNFTDYVKLNTSSGVISNKTFSLDVASQTGLNFVSILLAGAASISAYINIYDLYLIP